MRVAAFVVTLAAVLGTACGGSTEPGSVVPPSPPPPPPPPNTVAVTSNQFSPTPLNVAKGTTVTWSFQGGTHNVTFEDNQSSSSDKSSGSHERTFSGSGTFRYRCTIHSGDFATGMVGSVVVQ